MPFQTRGRLELALPSSPSAQSRGASPATLLFILKSLLSNLSVNGDRAFQCLAAATFIGSSGFKEQKIKTKPEKAPCHIRSAYFEKLS